MSARVFEQHDDDIVMIAAARTPIGKFGGALAKVSAIDLGAVAVKAAVERAGIAPDTIDELIVGQVGGWGPNGFVARAVGLKAGLPQSVCAYSVNRQCGSGLQSLVDGFMELKLGLARVVVAGGTENVSELPYYVREARFGAKMGHTRFEDGVLDILTWPLDDSHNGITAENVATTYAVSREEQDEYAARSQQRACAARNSGIFADEIVPVEVPGRKGSVTVVDTDEGPREGVTAESLSRLKPCFVSGGTVTAGNSSTLNDAAAAVVLTTRAYARELGCEPLAVIRGFAFAGFDAALMGYSPYFSSRKLAEQLDLDVREIDMVEINEAFASQTVAVMRDLGLESEKVNIYGGGISLGHPLGATGTCLAVKCAYELARGAKRDALIAMCIGGGQGVSMYLTRE